MPLTSLVIKNFRNIEEASVDFGLDFNFFQGDNGAGKSNLLEAIGYLGTGRSFRCRTASHLIQEQKEKFILFGNALYDQNNIALGIERVHKGKCQLHINGQPVDSFAEFAKWLPLQTLNQESYQLLIGGPKYRRKLIDWGVFHVEHTPIELWHKIGRLLQQRNMAIKQQYSYQRIEIWDNAFVLAASELHKIRQRYISSLIPLLKLCFSEMLAMDSVNITYYAGWNEEIGLSTTLKESWLRDRNLGFTQFGPQRADLVLHIRKKPIQDMLSRGQQKLFLLALYVAQLRLLQQATQQRSMLLIDDLLAELDIEKQKKVFAILQQLDAQIFITSIDLQNFINIVKGEAFKNIKLFHVERGIINNK